MKRLVLSIIALGLTANLAQAAQAANAPGSADPADVLLAADRAFAAKSHAEGPNAAFGAFAAPKVTLPNLANPDSTAEEQGKRFPPNLKVDWEPVAAKIAKSGDLGYSWGKATIQGTDKEGKPVTSHSRYVTVWQKQPDGSWKFILDFGADDPAP